MRRRPIGQILVESNEISEEDLEAALKEQELSGRRLGEILIEQGRTSWLALARAIAEQVLDIKEQPAEPSPPPRPPEQDPVAMVRAMAERVANLPPVPERVPPPAPVAQDDPERELAREMAEQVANLAAPSPIPQETHLLQLKPKPATPAQPEIQPFTPDPFNDPEARLLSVETLLRERQRAFIELVTTTETLRMKVTRLEEILEERDRELARLRVLRAS
jgi:hypothetical protein